MKKERLSDSAVEKLSLPRTIHMVPLNTINGFDVRPGLYEINGATAIPGGVNFTVYSHGATSIELLLFERDAQEPYAVLPFPQHYRIGNVYSMIVFKLDIESFEYAYRVDGPYEPEKGKIFDRHKYLLDPYARAVTGQSRWGDSSPRGQHYKARVVKDDFDWGDTRQPLIPTEDLLIYELHVRGFTRDHSSGVAYPGTFAGLMEKLPYLESLGVNAIELMPIFEFDEMQDYREVGGEKLYNYWGYNTVSFFSPNTSYAASTEYNREGNELKNLIRACHRRRIEVYLDVVFNHTAEGNEQGPFFSFKGFDNNIYYLLTPEGKYYNFSGCGNTLNCNHPMVHQMIMDCLRYWVTAYRIDGFRFDLASILGRNEDGSPMNKPPLRVLHTSDWHIGRTLYGRKRYESFAAFLLWLGETIREERVDVLVVAGDVFDTSAPSNRSQELYYRFLCRIREHCRHVVIVAGNHDSPSFLAAPKELLRALNVHVIGAMSDDPAEETLVLRGRDGEPELIVCAVPYLRDRDIRTSEAGESLEDKEAKLLEGIRRHYAAVCALAASERSRPDLPLLATGHLFAAGGLTQEGDGVRQLYVGSLARVGADCFPDCIDYLALGHLHIPQKLGGSETRRYSGSPLPMNFGERTGKSLPRGFYGPESRRALPARALLSGSGARRRRLGTHRKPPQGARRGRCEAVARNRLYGRGGDERSARPAGKTRGRHRDGAYPRQERPAHRTRPAPRGRGFTGRARRARSF